MLFLCILLISDCRGKPKLYLFKRKQIWEWLQNGRLHIFFKFYSKNPFSNFNDSEFWRKKCVKLKNKSRRNSRMTPDCYGNCPAIMMIKFSKIFLRLNRSKKRKRSLSVKYMFTIGTIQGYPFCYLEIVN